MILEDLSGEGRVFSGATPLCNVEYRLVVEQDQIETTPGAEPVLGLKDSSGSISIIKPHFFLGFTNLLDLFVQHAQKTLTLELEDGRRQDFLLKDNQGTIRGYGDLAP